MRILATVGQIGMGTDAGGGGSEMNTASSSPRKEISFEQQLLAAPLDQHGLMLCLRGSEYNQRSLYLLSSLPG